MPEKTWFSINEQALHSVTYTALYNGTFDKYFITGEQT